MLISTAKPTKTVEARKAGLKIEEKFSKLPKHLTSGSGIRPSDCGVELQTNKQNIKWTIYEGFIAQKLFLRGLASLNLINKPLPMLCTG